MKSKTGWLDNGNGTNESGFSGLPGGAYFFRGPLAVEGGYWWSSTEDYPNNTLVRSLYSSNGSVNWDAYSKSLGFSVRCLRD